MSKIANIDICNRPREKALVSGIHTLNNQELLALIIRCGTKGISALEIGENILKKYGTLNALFNCDIYSLMEIKGIKKAKALELIAILELAKRASDEKKVQTTYIKNALDIYNLYKIPLENCSQENFVVIFLNIKLKIIKKETLFVGGEVSSIVDVNLIFKKALTCGARKIICLHNHPSGDIYPSREDIELTNTIKKVGEIVKIELLDHIIIGKDNFFSFKQSRP